MEGAAAPTVIPAYAGIQVGTASDKTIAGGHFWIPAYAGMTVGGAGMTVENGRKDGGKAAAHYSR